MDRLDVLLVIVALSVIGQLLIIFLLTRRSRNGTAHKKLDLIQSFADKQEMGSRK